MNLSPGPRRTIDMAYPVALVSPSAGVEQCDERVGPAACLLYRLSAFFLREPHRRGRHDRPRKQPEAFEKGF
jgi:hypothetical protein